MASRFHIAAAVLLEELAKPYEPGVADCFVLGCRIADAFDPGRAMTDRYARAYSTLAGAQRALRRRGYADLVAFWEKHLPRVAPAAAQTGDLVVLSLPFDGGRMVEHVGVMFYSRAVTKTERGRTDHDIAAAIAAFRTSPESAA